MFVTTARQQVVHRDLGSLMSKHYLSEQHHTVPYMRRFCVGLGLLRKQNPEFNHAEFNCEEHMTTLLVISSG